MATEIILNSPSAFRKGRPSFGLIMRLTVSTFLLLFLCSQVESAELRQSRDLISALVSAQVILVETDLSDPQTGGGAAFVEKIVTKRLEELKFTVETDKSRKHDVVVQVICGESMSPGFPSKPDSFNGPPCLFHYRFQGKLMPWVQVERFIYSEGVKTATSLLSRDPTALPSTRIRSYLQEFDFPLLLSAEWGHIDRLLQLFESPSTSHFRKEMVMVLLGEIQAEAAFNVLVEALEDKSLRAGAARALGEFGEKARRPLTSLLETSTSPEVQSAAIHGLGRVGALTGDTSSTALLLRVLQTPGVNRGVQTEAVWALGKAPDFRAFPILAELEREIWMIQSNDPELGRLRQAVDWSIREVRQGGHTDDY